MPKASWHGLAAIQTLAVGEQHRGPAFEGPWVGVEVNIACGGDSVVVG